MEKDAPVMILILAVWPDNSSRIRHVFLIATNLCTGGRRVFSSEFGPDRRCWFAAAVSGDRLKNEAKRYSHVQPHQTPRQLGSRT